MGQDRVLFRFLESSLPITAWILSAFPSNDHITKQVLLFLRDIADVQLARLPLSCSVALYEASCIAIRHVFEQVNKAATTLAAGRSAQDAELHNSVCILLLLQLLNHLSTKDFLLDDDTTGECITATSERRFVMHVADVLLLGLEVMTQLVTPSILKAFPLAADRYFSFIVLLVGAFEREVGDRILNRPSRERGELAAPPAAMLGLEPARLYAILVEHSLWASTAIADSRTARLALQVISCNLNTSNTASQYSTTSTMITLNGCRHCNGWRCSL